MITKQDWIETKVYSFRELLEILINCKTEEDIEKLSDYIMSYKKKYSLNDLGNLMVLMQSQHNKLNKN